MPLRYVCIAKLAARRSSHAVLSLLLELSALLHINLVDVTLLTFQAKFLDMSWMTWNACSLTPSEKRMKLILLPETVSQPPVQPKIVTSWANSAINGIHVWEKVINWKIDHNTSSHLLATCFFFWFGGILGSASRAEFPCATMLALRLDCSRYVEQHSPLSRKLYSSRCKPFMVA